MHRYFLSLLALTIVVGFNGCQRDDDPFEYPDGTITDPSTVIQMTRIIAEDENWIIFNNANGCDPNFGVQTFAQAELNVTRGFASMYLVPDTSACKPIVSFETPFQPDEVPSAYWDNWKLEFTFSEIQLNDASELRLAFDYREVELDIDLAPIMRQLLAPDTTVNDTDGVFVLEFQEGFTNFFLNGVNWNPDFSAQSDDSLVKDAVVTEPRFKITLSSEGTDARSLLLFTFIRVTSYGIPEQ